MKIKEISGTPNHDEYVGKFVNAKTTKRHGQLANGTLWDQTDEGFGDETWRLHTNANPSELISYLLLEQTAGGMQIRQTYTVEKFRRQSFMRTLLKLALTTHKFLLSDDRQTPQAQDMWKNLILYPGTNTISLLNTNTGQKTAVKYKPNGQLNINPWDDSSDTVLMIEQRILSPFEVKILEQEQEHLSRIGTKIWFMD